MPFFPRVDVPTAHMPTGGAFALVETAIRSGYAAHVCDLCGRVIAAHEPHRCIVFTLPERRLYQMRTCLDDCRRVALDASSTPTLPRRDAQSCPQDSTSITSAQTTTMTAAPTAP